VAVVVDPSDHDAESRERTGALPSFLIIGAMKCGTSALHRYLSVHPEVAISEPKELKFFVGPASIPSYAGSWSWQRGNWHRGTAWHKRHFAAHARARGEAPPAYTSPSFPEAAGRIARVVPDARLLYLVRDPMARAVSQYWHPMPTGPSAGRSPRRCWSRRAST
jgi:Sulfotransferase family